MVKMVVSHLHLYKAQCSILALFHMCVDFAVGPKEKPAKADLASCLKIEMI